MVKKPQDAAPRMPDQRAVDQRSYQRLPRPYPALIKPIMFPMSKEPEVETICCDISKGGVCVESPTPFAKGDACQVRICIPLLNKFSPSFFKVYENDAEQYFTSLAKVAWVKPVGDRRLVGFRFVGVDENQGVALERLIQKAFAVE